VGWRWVPNIPSSTDPKSGSDSLVRSIAGPSCVRKDRTSNGTSDKGMGSREMLEPTPGSVGWRCGAATPVTRSTRQWVEELDASVFEVVATGEAMRVLVIDAAGPSFTVGGDLAYFTARLDGLAAELEWMVSSYHESLCALAEIPVPVVCAVQGAAAGRGTRAVVVLRHRYRRQRPQRGHGLLTPGRQRRRRQLVVPATPGRRIGVRGRGNPGAAGQADRSAAARPNFSGPLTRASISDHMEVVRPGWCSRPVPHTIVGD
jgi:hypothetical protein